MNDSWIESFKGQHVTVLTVLGTEERNDTGTIVEFGGGWVQLAKDNGDMILVPSTAIRIIKLLSMNRAAVGIERANDHNTEGLGRTETNRSV